MRIEKLGKAGDDIAILVDRRVVTTQLGQQMRAQRMGFRQVDPVPQGLIHRRQRLLVPIGLAQGHRQIVQRAPVVRLGAEHRAKSFDRRIMVAARLGQSGAECRQPGIVRLDPAKVDQRLLGEIEFAHPHRQRRHVMPRVDITRGNGCGAVNRAQRLGRVAQSVQHFGIELPQLRDHRVCLDRARQRLAGIVEPSERAIDQRPHEQAVGMRLVSGRQAVKGQPGSGGITRLELRHRARNDLLCGSGR